MDVFDKKVLMNNIKILAKNTNKKIGDIEKEANISAGYFSRLNNDDNSTVPSIEVIHNVSKQFNISLDLLVNVDFSKINSTELYLLKFLNKLIVDTKSNNMIWFKDGIDQIYNKIDGEFTHPLIQTGFDYAHGSNPYYCSLVDSSIDFELPSEIYHFGHYDKTFYLVKINCLPTNVEVYEMYIKDSCNLKLICSTFYSTEDFKKTMIEVFKVATEDVKKMKIDFEVRKAIDDFMNDDLPF